MSEWMETGHNWVRPLRNLLYFMQAYVLWHVLCSQPDMKINSETVLAGERIVLVPYKKEHVPR